MKKILILLLVCMTSFAQEKESYFSLSAGADVKCSLVGSKPTNNQPSLDLIVAAHMVGNDFELSVGDEYFKQIGFNRFFMNAGFHFPMYIPEEFFPVGDSDLNFTLVPYVGTSNITRFGFEDRIVGDRYIYGRSSHLAVQGGLSVRFELLENLLLDFSSELLTRQDLQYRYFSDNPKFIVLSNYVSLHYKF